MNSGVEHGPEDGGSTGDVLNADPPQGEHRRVMVDMEERQLAEFTAEDEEQRVGHLEAFGHVVPPQRRRYPHSPNVVGVVDRLAYPTEAGDRDGQLVGDVGVEADDGGVVDGHDGEDDPRR